MQGNNSWSWYVQEFEKSVVVERKKRGKITFLLWEFSTHEKISLDWEHKESNQRDKNWITRRMHLQISRLEKRSGLSNLIFFFFFLTRPVDLGVDNRGKKTAVDMVRADRWKTRNYCSCGKWILQGYRNQQRDRMEKEGRADFNI